MTDDDARWCRLLAWREEMRSLNVTHPRGETIDGADMLWLIDQLARTRTAPRGGRSSSHRTVLVGETKGECTL